MKIKYTKAYNLVNATSKGWYYRGLYPTLKGRSFIMAIGRKTKYTVEQKEEISYYKTCLRSLDKNIRTKFHKGEGDKIPNETWRRYDSLMNALANIVGWEAL